MTTNQSHPRPNPSLLDRLFQGVWCHLGLGGGGGKYGKKKYSKCMGKLVNLMPNNSRKILIEKCGNRIYWSNFLGKPQLLIFFKLRGNFSLYIYCDFLPCMPPTEMVTWKRFSWTIINQSHTPSNGLYNLQEGRIN